MKATEPMQQEMLDFEAHWYRLGGGPAEEISARFGMNERAFFGEMHELIGTDTVLSAVSAREAEVMRGVVRRRLWLAS